MPFEAQRAELTHLEQIAEQPPCRVGDDHHARLGRGLQARREIWRIAHHRLLLRRSLADQIADHDQTGRDADASR